MNKQDTQAAIVSVAAITLSAIGVTLYALQAIDSPIDISDGSIHATVRNANASWVRVTQGEVYQAKSTNSDYIVLRDFKDPSGDASDKTFTNTGGWLIHITNGNPRAHANNRHSIKFCSLTSGNSCVLATPAGGNWVFIETHPNSLRGSWEEQASGPSPIRALNFRDRRSECNTDDCNHMLEIKFLTKNSGNNLPGPSGNTYTCNRVDQCTITVGN